MPQELLRKYDMVLTTYQGERVVNRVAVYCFFRTLLIIALARLPFGTQCSRPTFAI